MIPSDESAPSPDVQACPASDAPARRPYRKPGFSRESVFETMALACGKVRGQAQNQCRRVASNS